MGYDRGDSFPYDFEPNRIPFGSKSKGKLSPRSYPIQCERKWKYSFLSVTVQIMHLHARGFFVNKKATPFYAKRNIFLSVFNKNPDSVLVPNQLEKYN